MEMETGTFYQLFGNFIDWIGTHQTLTGVLIFLVAMTESLVLVGILMPGAIIMVGAGILISLGKLELWPCLAWAAAGAIAGDGISFWIGYHYKDRLRKIWPFSKTKKLLQKGEEFFKKHGGKSVVLGRFFGPVRAIVPTIAGMLGMQPKRFAFVNILSALAWAPAYILPGLVVGASLQLASEIAFRLVIVMILLVIFYITFHWLIKHLIRYLQHHTQSMTHLVLSWSSRHPFIGQYTSALFKPDTPAYKSLIISGAIFLLASALFILMLIFGFSESKGSGISYTSYQFFQSLRTPFADHLMVFITMLTEPWIYISTAIAVSCWLMFNKMIETLVHFLFAIGMTALLLMALGSLINVPEAAKLNVSASSIAHTTLSLVIFGFVARLLSRVYKRSGVYITLSLFIVLTVISKLYLGHFWLSEIIASIMLGLILLSLTGISLQKYSSRDVSVNPLLWVFCLTFVLVSSLQLYINFESRLTQYQVTVKMTPLSFSSWWNSDWKKLPTWRSDLRSYQQQPMNIQFTGSLSTLKTQLLEQGWRSPEKFHLKSMVHWLNSSASLSKLPILPHVHRGQHQLFIMSFPASSYFWGVAREKQWVLRLWKSDYQLSSSKETIYIGNISSQTSHDSLGILSYPITTSDFIEPMRTLLTQVKQFKYKVVKRQSRSHKFINWDGQILLLTGKLQLQ
ncbi:hypothetical protein MNBD_GAMMA12-1453 [hydrothermal vent metagenome]|uniref:Uncharacterized protein n=1 Tax=hydrothermal vent metagenome TaxID=652676 RepID=A0A3B0YPI5_9ZZZZ